MADIEEQAQKRFERIVEQMAESEGITEQLKATDQVAAGGRCIPCGRLSRSSNPVHLLFWTAFHVLINNYSFLINA